MTASKQPEPEILPEGQYNVLVNTEHVFVATNARNPRRWKAIENEDGSTTYIPA